MGRRRRWRIKPSRAHCGGWCATAPVTDVSIVSILQAMLVHPKTHARDPQTGRVVSLFNPRRQRWSRHFTWSEDFLRIIGRTATGRATVATLHLNRPELRNLRQVLRAVGEHPP